jgi:predicted nucleotidyltransferase
MSVVAEYRKARSAEEFARLRRVVALRAMVASGMSQRRIALELGISQPAVSQQIHNAPDLVGLRPEVLIEAAAPVLSEVAGERGFTRLAVFGSVAVGNAGVDSDIDLLVEAPPGTSIKELLDLRGLLATILGRPVDLVTYGALKPDLDDDIRREAVLLT